LPGIRAKRDPSRRVRFDLYAGLINRADRGAPAGPNHPVPTGMSDFVPKGLQDSAWGFNPRCRFINAPPRRGGRSTLSTRTLDQRNFDPRTVDLQHLQPATRGAIRTWRNTPTLQYSITPRGRIRGRTTTSTSTKPRPYRATAIPTFTCLMASSTN
jgi:hypothetical protein